MRFGSFFKIVAKVIVFLRFWCLKPRGKRGGGGGGGGVQT